MRRTRICRARATTTVAPSAVTLRNTPGAPVWMAVSLNIDAGRGAPGVVDSGNYTTYAGPVYVTARGECMGSAEPGAGTAAGALT
ncbi:hypothetical protein [Streptomyces inhibens]|uniref:hypothetical protein n=1 Tax=Streptomyces inhibens TaxID=2293571 RepID=UPI001EE69BB8|nr:hypothetical protein [Streptomyces inhibens]UKY47588.1 hypothetical protein KI385_01185 [Streptomyces inhibens]